MNIPSSPFFSLFFPFPFSYHPEKLTFHRVTWKASHLLWSHRDQVWASSLAGRDTFFACRGRIPTYFALTIKTWMLAKPKQDCSSSQQNPRWPVRTKKLWDRATDKERKARWFLCQ